MISLDRTHTAVVALLILLAGCGSKDASPAGPGGGAGGPPPVTVATPLVKRVVDWDDYSGRFEAVGTAEIRPRVSGYIQSVNFRDGQFVDAGDLLFRIDPRQFKADYDQAKADEARFAAALILAQQNAARAEKLFAAEASSHEELDNARAAARQAAAALGAARAATAVKALDLSFTRVTAPISGRVSDRRLSTGNYVTAGQTPLTTIVTLNPIHFVFEGSESIYLKYQRANRAGTRPSSRISANPVEIRLGDETDYRWKGRMDFVDNALDTGSGTIRGRAVIPNPDGFLTPGLFGHMRLLGSGAYDGLLIPESSVVTDQINKVVLVVGKDGKVAARPVQLGPIVDGLRIVRSGLQRTDRVIIEGVQRARPGTPVQAKSGRIVPPAPGTAPAADAPPIIVQPASDATPAEDVPAVRR